jgi:hypothetical protein
LSGAANVNISVHFQACRLARTKCCVDILKKTDGIVCICEVSQCNVRVFRSFVLDFDVESHSPKARDLVPINFTGHKAKRTEFIIQVKRHIARCVNADLLNVASIDVRDGALSFVRELAAVSSAYGEDIIDCDEFWPHAQAFAVFIVALYREGLRGSPIAGKVFAGGSIFLVVSRTSTRRSKQF